MVWRAPLNSANYMTLQWVPVRLAMGGVISFDAMSSLYYDPMSLSSEIG